MAYIITIAIDYDDPISGRVRQLPPGAVAPAALVQSGVAAASLAPDFAWRGFDEKAAFEKRVVSSMGRSRALAEQIAREELEAVNRLTADNDRRQAEGVGISDPWLELICRIKQVQAGAAGIDFHDAYDRVVAEQAV